MNGDLLTIENLSISFGSVRPVVDASLSLPGGSMLALVGESGSGKSLTAASVIGLIPPPGRVAAGRVLFDGRDVAALDPEEMRSLRGREIGMVFQEPMTSLNPVFTVGFHLKEALTSHVSATPGQVRERSLELLAEVGVPDPAARLGAYPHELSGGLRQRVMIACAFAMNPRLLIADEPTTALDVTVEAGIMELMGTLMEARGASVLFVTHDLGLVASHADLVAVIYAGYTVELAPVGELFRNPLHPYTRALMESMPGNAAGRRLTPIPGVVPSPGNLPSGCPFRDRCALALPACAEGVPVLLNVGAGRSVRCIRAGDA